MKGEAAWLVHDGACTGRARGLGLVLWVRERASTGFSHESREVHWLAEWRKQLVRCFVCASTHGLKLFEFEFEWCTVRLRWLAPPNPLLPTTYSPTSLPPSLSCPSLLSNRRFFFFFFFPAKPLSLFLLVASSLSYPRAPPFSLSLFRSFLTSLRSVLSMSVQFFFFLPSLCLCQAARFLGPAPLNPQGPLVDEGRIWIVQLQSWTIILFM